MTTYLVKNEITGGLLHDEGGQDLVEYSVIIALIAFAAIAGMSTIANNINTGFNNIGATVTSYT